MTGEALGELVQRLVKRAPDSAEAEAIRYAIESLLMSALREGGRAAGEAAVESLANEGYALERLPALPCMWRVMIPLPHVLEIWFTGGDEPFLAAVSYRTGAPWGSKRQRRAARLQALFYERYQGLEPEAKHRQIDEQLILAVGEFEADVSNGGFRQYLENKGEARARDTLAMLSLVGANRTKRWLAAALDHADDDHELEKLDDQFNARAEDLAALVMAYLEKIRK